MKFLALLLAILPFMLAFGSGLDYEKFNPGCTAPTTWSPIDIDVGKWTGRWYEIYNTLNSVAVMEKGCSCIYSEYGYLSKTSFSVTNYCWNEEEQKGTDGTATATEVSPGTFNFQFFPFQFWKAPFQVIYLEGNYEIAIAVSCSPYRDSPVLGGTANDFVWVLAKTPEITDVQNQNVINWLRQNKFDVDQLHQAKQGGQQCENFYKGKYDFDF